MSQENVEFVRRIYDLLSQADEEAFFELVPADFVYDFSRRLIDPTVVRGHEQLRAFAERERQFWEGGRIYWEPKELIDAGDKVVTLTRTAGRGKTSGAQVEASVWNVWAFRDGQPVEVTYFGEDRSAALEAAGLSEQDAHADS
jgi:ketosteroid isomerase-like protein